MNHMQVDDSDERSEDESNGDSNVQDDDTLSADVDGDDLGQPAPESDDDEASGECPELTLPDDNLLDLPPDATLRRLPCLAHTLQLIIKPVYKHYDVLLTKTRRLVGRVRKSGVAMEKLINACGKSVISDCTTRWSSTYTMLKRLITIKTTLNEVLTDLGRHYCCVIFLND
jgi:DNA-directed RNA polymerase subunit N (RpoN/RPB10)